MAHETQKPPLTDEEAALRMSEATIARGFEPGRSLLVNITPAPRAEIGVDISFGDDDDISGRYASTRAASEAIDAEEELEAEFGPELDAEEEPEAPQEPAPQQALADPRVLADLGVSPDEFSVLNKFSDVFSDIGEGVAETVTTPRVIPGGVRDAAQETLEAMDSLAIWLNTHVADLTVFDPETAPRFDLPEVASAESVTGGIVRGIVQFITGMIGAGRATGLSKLKNLSKVGEAGRLGIQGAIADAIARDPNEANLADFLRNPDLTPDQQSAVVRFLASDPDDSEGVARLKKAFEGFGIGAVVDGLILTLGAIRASRGLRKGAKKVGQLLRDESGVVKKKSRGDLRPLNAR